MVFEFIPVNLFKRGTICVIRNVEGKRKTLAIEGQCNYQEFNGCFSVL